MKLIKYLKTVEDIKEAIHVYQDPINGDLTDNAVLAEILMELQNQIDELKERK